MKAYIIKYALTKGIYEINAEACGKTSTNIIEDVDSQYTTFYHGEGDEWCRTWEDAVKVAEKMRDKKIISLEKKINKLKNMKFEKGES